mgnify:CR=1 FL=1
MGELLKEAIADAKAIRETALANAKLALEEAFTPRLQSMLDQKIRAEVADVDGVEGAEGGDDIEISDEDAGKIKTVGDVISHIQKLIEQ